MIEQLTEMMVRSGATWVLWLLFGLSVLSLATAIDRWWVLRSAGCNMAHLVPELRRLLRNGELENAQKHLQAQESVPTEAALAGLAELDHGPGSAEEAMAAAMGLHRARLERRLMFLGTVGNNAPFIGLLGTVIGIVGAFDALGQPVEAAANAAAGAAAAGLAPERVMSTIAEALVATAIGLLVAIPAVAVFNYLQGRVGAVMADAETLGHVVLSHMKVRGAVGAVSDARSPTGKVDGVVAGRFSEVPAE